MENITIKLLILLLVGFSGCKIKKTETVVESFPTNRNLVSKTINVPVNLLMPAKIITTDKHLVIFELQENEMFKIFELPTINYVFSWGTKGKGPDEVNLIEHNSIKGFQDRFVFLDNLKFQTAIIRDDSVKIIKKQWLKPQSEPINGLLMLNDSIFIFDRSSKDKFEHICVNLNNEKGIFNFGDFDDKLNIKDPATREMVYLKKKASKPDGERFVSFYLLFNRFKLYDKNCKLLKEVVLKDKNLEKPFKLGNFKDYIKYNSCLYTTDYYIFVLNPNKTIAESSQVTNKYPSLSVWDWDGNPIARYKLDKDVSTFTVSEKYRKIYGVSYNKMNEIYEYEIPHELVEGVAK